MNMTFLNGIIDSIQETVFALCTMLKTSCSQSSSDSKQQKPPRLLKQTITPPERAWSLQAGLAKLTGLAGDINVQVRFFYFMFSY